MIAIISDIHGNYPALDAVLKEIDMLGCEKIISLGDVAGYYCMVNECITTLCSRGIINLMGNHDSYVLSGAHCPRSKSANVCLEYQSGIITDANLAWLSGSPLGLKEDSLNMVHGGWNDPLDEYIYQPVEQYFDKVIGRYFLSGHTHIQLFKSFGHVSYCNPGSVGQPRDGDPRAAFALIDSHEIILRRVEYDIDRMAQAMEAAGFSSRYYSNLYSGTKIGEQAA